MFKTVAGECLEGPFCVPHFVTIVEESVLDLKTREIFERGLKFDDFLIFGQRRVLVLTKLVDVGVELDDRIKAGDRGDRISNPFELSSEVAVGDRGNLRSSPS